MRDRNKDEDKGIHDGHRKRMRDKLISHGTKIFDTYEILEMLLYSVVPYKDTNPLSKNLLERFGGIGGVLSADRESLMQVKGVGERTADFIVAIGNLFRIDNVGAEPCVFDDYFDTGRYFVDLFESNENVDVAVLLLDNGMRYLGLSTVEGVAFGSAGIKPRMLIDPAIRLGATVAILAYTHRHGPLFPTPSDITTSRMAKDELAAVGVRLLENYIVVGSRFIGQERGLCLRLSDDTPELNKFLDSCVRGGLYESE